MKSRGYWEKLERREIRISYEVGNTRNKKATKMTRKISESMRGKSNIKTRVLLIDIIRQWSKDWKGAMQMHGYCYILQLSKEI